MDSSGRGRLTTVCLLSPSALPLVMPSTGGKGGAGRAGGAELDVWQIATALARDPSFRPSLAAIGDTNHRTPIEGVDVVSIARYRPERTRRGHFARYCGRVVRVLRNLDADVYFCKGASLEVVLCFVAARVLRRRRFVFRLQHDWEATPQTLTDKIFGGQRLLARLFMVALRRADALVAQTHAQQRLLKASFGLESTVLYNSHPIPAAAPLEDKRTVLWVGRAAAYKRPQVFLDLASRLSSYPFVMVATFDANHPSVLDALRERSRQLPNVTFIEGAARAEVEALFRSARVYVLSSEAEGFPNVLVEAWKNRTPVASLRLDPDGLIRQHQAGFVADDDPDGLARGVEELLRDDTVFRHAAERGYTLARDLLDIDRTIERYKAIFTEQCPPPQ
jgi:glycosyltransferase involved in cell wall biosynthesis